MTAGLESFYEQISNREKLTDRELVSFFVLYITEIGGEEYATARRVDECFSALDMTTPTRTSSYLSEGLSSQPPKYVKTTRGYKLHRGHRDIIFRQLESKPTISRADSELRRLEATLSAGPKKEFLAEALNCYEIGANRAAIVLCWLLTVDHLYDAVLQEQLDAFNAELAKVKDKRVRITRVTKKDDFSEIPEGKFIELLRAANIISNDVRKILDQKLGVRNSAAHPSAISFKKAKMLDFFEDLVENVVLKFPTK